jgi:hypothetical protein
MAKTSSARPPGRATVTAEVKPTTTPAKTSRRGGRGDKYALVKSVLRSDPVAWIEKRRAPKFRRPDGRYGALSFREIADLITEKMKAKLGDESFVTLESVRRWYRDKHVTG